MKSVLIVDDDADVRHLLRLLFEVEGYDVCGAAANGLEAVTMARLHRPHFIILDYRMPGMDGEEAATAIREFLPRTRIVAFSAVLDHKPEWADAHLNKERVDDVAPLISRMLEATDGNQRV
jgi:two-component system response regulator AlgR